MEASLPFFRWQCLRNIEAANKTGISEIGQLTRVFPVAGRAYVIRAFHKQGASLLFSRTDEFRGMAIIELTSINWKHRNTIDAPRLPEIFCPIYDTHSLLILLEKVLYTKKDQLFSKTF